MRYTLIRLAMILIIPVGLFALWKTLTFAIDLTTNQTATESVQLNAKERMDKLMKSPDPEVQGLVTQMQSTKFGFIATLEKIVGSSLQLQTVNGSQKIVELDKQAVLLKNQKAISRSDIELNSPIIIMGYLDTNGVYLGRRLIIADDTIYPAKRNTVYGTITSLTTKILSIATKTDVGNSLDIKLTSKTTYFNTLGNTIKRTDLKLQDPIIAILPDGPIATASALRIYSLSPKAIPSPTIPSSGN